MISAADVEATLRYLVPGFVALKVFSVLGLKTKRTDLELTLWSLLAAVLIDAGVSKLNPTDQDQRLVAALSIAMGTGVVLSVAWHFLKASSWLRAQSSPQAWDWAFSVSQWINVWTSSGKIVFGSAEVVASSAETDQLDLYIQDPYWLEDGHRKPMDNVAGLWISESEIQMIQVLGDRTETAEEQALIIGPLATPTSV
jgi:hypothetical protein